MIRQRWIQNAIPAALFAIFLSGCLADIRPESIKEGYGEADVEKGRALLHKAMARHGGLGRWKAHRTAEVTLTDDWRGFLLKTLFLPWPENKVPIKVQYLLGTNDSRGTFLEGSRKGETWGIQNWATYTQRPGEAPVFKKDKAIKFYMPTYQYFFELPFHLPFAGVVIYAGEDELAGQAYDVVFVSWNTDAPQAKIDQYLAYISRKTGLIDYLRYTVRDQFGFLVGNMQFTDYRDVQGIQVPFRQTVVDDDRPDGKKVMHQVLYKSAAFGVDVPDEAFYPDPDRRAKKQE